MCLSKTPIIFNIDPKTNTRCHPSAYTVPPRVVALPGAVEASEDDGGISKRKGGPHLEKGHQNPKRSSIFSFSISDPEDYRTYVLYI